MAPPNNSNDTQYSASMDFTWETQARNQTHLVSQPGEWIEMRPTSPVSTNAVNNLIDSLADKVADQLVITAPPGENSTRDYMDIDGEWIELDANSHSSRNTDSSQKKKNRKHPNFIIYEDSDSDTSMTTDSQSTTMTDISEPPRTHTILVRINTLSRLAMDWEILNIARHSVQARIDARRFENPSLSGFEGTDSRMLRIQIVEVHDDLETVYRSVEAWLGFLMENINAGFMVRIPYRVGTVSIDWLDVGFYYGVGVSVIR